MDNKQINSTNKQTNNAKKQLNYIKKHYGENFAKLCRVLFPCLLDVPAENPNSLQNVLIRHFSYSPTLYDDIKDISSTFRDVVYSLANFKKGYDITITDKSLEQLTSEAGYKLIKCETNDDVQKFRIFYTKDEKLCTFTDAERLNNSVIYFLVRKEFYEKDAKTGKDALKKVEDFPFQRDNYNILQREDEYGTSVLCVQFTIDEPSTISIITRYNHAVDNPNNAYGCNLELIQPGLTHAFAEREHLNFNTDIDRFDFFAEKMFDRGYVFDKDKKMHKVITTIKDGYACLNNYVVREKTCHSIPFYFDESRYVLFDKYIIDQQSKAIMNIGEISYISDIIVKNYFNKCEKQKKQPQNTQETNFFDDNDDEVDSFIKGISDIKKIEIKYDEKKNKVISLIPNDGETIEIKINKNGHIIKYSNPNITTVEDDFLNNATYIEEINLPNVETIGNNFLENNKNLTSINLPKVTKIGNNFLPENEKISNVELPNIKIVGKKFITNSKNITSINFPKLKKIDDFFVHSSENINFVNIPNVETIGEEFLYSDKNLTSINLPNVLKIGRRFLNSNISLKQIDLPCAVEINCYFMPCNENLTSINAPFLYYFYETEFLSKNKNREEFLKKMKTTQKQNRDNTYNWN